jgi:GrpB-like predicted nucleotidyltransferase (UPF0157 family)
VDVRRVAALGFAAVSAGVAEDVRPPEGRAVEPLEERIRRVTSEPVEVVDYDPDWPGAFAREKRHLLGCLPHGMVVRIEHFGSTAVSGLPAKPIVDVLVEVADLEAVRADAVPILEAQGYEYFWCPTFGDDGGPFSAWFIKRDPRTGKRTHHVHMVESGFTVHWDRLLFRDYLIAHPDVAADYGRLKRELAAEYPGRRVRYTEAKGDFIDRVTEVAKRGSDERLEGNTPQEVA